MLPEVSTALRPPATVWQASGLHRVATPSLSPGVRASVKSKSILQRLPRAALLILWSLAIGHWSSLPAHAVAPRLTNLLPPGGQRGTEVEVRFTGQRLDDTKEIVFYAPGIAVVSMDVSTNRLKAMLKIAPDCRLGEHTMRLRTATGVSEVRTFWVSAFTNLAEVEPNTEPTKAQPVPLNVTINGSITSDDLDYFAVTAGKGQRLTAEIEGMRLGRGAFDPYLAIQDKEGRLLSEAKDSALGLQDAIASVIAPEAGDYIVLVRDTAFGGRDDYHYRLHVGTFPRPTAVYPIAAQVGSTVRATFLGDVKGEFEQEIKLPDMPQEKFGVFARFRDNRGPADQTSSLETRNSKLETSQSLLTSAATRDEPGAPSPNWMRVTKFPTAIEAEPNDSRERTGEAHEVPVVFNGVLSKAGDHDWLRFHAKKGQNLQVTVFARRLRSPLDSAIQIVSSKGVPVADNDDAAGPDSSVNFKPDEDGEYSVLVRDHLKRGGPEFVYCVEVAPVEPSLTVKIPEVARNDTQSRQYIAVPRGNRFATLMSVKRASLSGDLVFRADGMPQGVTLAAETMPGKVDQFPLVFEAASDAPVTGKLIDLSAVATNRLAGHFRNDIELVQGPNNTSYYGTRVDKFLVAVTEAAPFRLRVVEPKVPLVQGGSMDLQVMAERDPGFEEPINVKMVWNPPGVTSLPDMTIPKGSNSVTYVLNAKPDADLRDWKIAVHGSAKVNDGDLFVSSQLAKLSVGEPFLTATIERTACEPGKSTNIVVKLEQRMPFEGKATIKLVGLSDKISVPSKEITKDDKEVVFQAKVDPGCSVGSQRNLFCTVAIEKDGEVIPHRVGQGGVFRVVPVKKPVVAAAEPKKVASK